MTTRIHAPTVLVGIDGTANCGAAVQWAAAEAARQGARLHAVHVVNLADRYDAAFGADAGLELARARETVPARVAALVFAAAVEVDLAVSVVPGDVVDRLVAEADEVSLVVVGTPDGTRHADLASTLATHCSCPVAVVAENGDAELVYPDTTLQPRGASHVGRP